MCIKPYAIMLTGKDAPEYNVCARTINPPQPSQLHFLSTRSAAPQHLKRDCALQVRVALAADDGSVRLMGSRA